MQYIQLQSQVANETPTPESGKFNFFIDEDGLPKIKDSNGTVITVDGEPITLVSLTYDSFITTIMNNDLTKGAYYEINDYETCYDQPDFDIYSNAVTSGNYKTSGSIDPIIVFATGTGAISDQAFQVEYPKDKIRYDWTYATTEVTGGSAKGRITERIDEYGNRTDYDHRTIVFKRYQNYAKDVDRKYVGTVNLLDGTVTGTDTLFTQELGTNNVIIIDNTEYRITAIADDTNMTVTGLTYNNTNGAFYYNVETLSVGYKRNNLDDPSTSFTEYYTFQFEDETYFNNYIGDFANLRNWSQKTFLLANNVFLAGNCLDNKLGDNCYNNTIDDDFTGNVIGENFYNNTANDDFHDNIIGNDFYGNTITANFNNNTIGYSFRENIIINSDFYRNHIGNEFYSNNIVNNDYDFQNNTISNGFNDNVIKQDFIKNHIGVGFNNNVIEIEFEGNVFGAGANDNNFTLNLNNNGYFNDNIIGNYFGENNLIGEFRENRINHNFEFNTIIGHDNNSVDFQKNEIGSYFGYNTIKAHFVGNKIGNDFTNNNIGTDQNSYGNFENNAIGNNAQNNTIDGAFYDNTILNGFQSNDTTGTFYYNQIGHWFNDNTVLEEFAHNKIGNGFYNNNIGEYFGYGYGTIRGNVIADNFRDNTIRDHFYDNVISNGFENNTTPANFQFNDVKCVIFDVDFTEFNKQIQNISYPPTSTTNPDGSYSGIAGTTTNGLGKNALFQVDILTGSVSNITIQAQGSDYEVNDTITIPAATLNTSVDLVITVTAVSNSAMVAAPYNCTISNGPDGVLLSSLTNSGWYWMTQINGIFD